MATTQAKRIRDILIDAIRAYNPSINLSTSGRAYSEIVTPVYESLRPDMFEEDVETYLLAAIKEQYPSLELKDGDLIVDLLVRPLQLLLEPMKREINLLRKRQSVRYQQSMTMEDAEDLAANFFITRRTGRVASGTVRVYLTNPTYLTINRGVRFSTTDDLGFVAARQEFIPAGVVATQRENGLYYADIQVISESVGDQYNVPANTVVRMQGIPGFVQCTNPDPMFSGAAEETKEELLSRVEASLTERSLTTSTGITARLFNDFTSIDHVQVIGYGDPEMDRDILTGTGDGELLASGVSILFGRYVFMLTGYENAADGNKLPKKGDKVKLNFWKFIYGSTSLEETEIQDIVYTSYGDAKDAPTVHIFLLKSAPSTVMEPTGALPGVLPGVFISIFGDPTISISGVPVGVYSDDTELPYQIASNEVHIGGKYDVWVMPSVTETATTAFSLHKTPDVLKQITVGIDGTPNNRINGFYAKNRIRVSDYIIQTDAPLTVRYPITGSVNKSTAFLAEERPDLGLNYYSVTCRSGQFTIGETLTLGILGTQANIVSIDYTAALRSDIGSVITTKVNEQHNSYTILRADDNYYVINAEIEDEASNVSAYIHRETGLDNMFNPKIALYPTMSDYSTGLQTYVGRTDVYISQDLIAAGVASGDTLEILSGEDRGLFSISEIAQHTTSQCKLTISPAATKTNSNLRFRIVRTTEAVSSPFVSMLPSGVVTQVGEVAHTIPYAKSVGAYALGAFSGTVSKSQGANGFALPNMGLAFKGPGANASDILLTPDATVLAQFTNTKFDDCISEGCTPCNGIPVVIVVTVDGQASQYSNTKTYIEGLTSSQANSYLSSIRLWLKSMIDSFFRGSNSTSTTTADDLDAFVDMFAPFIFGQPSNTNEHIISRIEMCIPNEVFDGNNNVYMAIPEIAWDSAFTSVTTFEQAIIDFLSGDLYRDQPALSLANAGDSLKVDFGANAGEYVIDKVVNIPLYTDSSIATEITELPNNQQVIQYSINESRVFNYTLVVIKGELPEEVLNGSSEYFLAQIPNVNSILPVAPAYPSNIEVRSISGQNAGSLLNPFSVVEDLYTVLFQSLYAQGLDLPDEVEFAPGPTLTKIVHLMFSSYTTGVRSPQQTVRMLFQDPIDVTVYSPKVERYLEWFPEILDAPLTESTEPLALPLPILGGRSISLKYTRNLDQVGTTISGTLNTLIDQVTDIDTFVDYLQQALDPEYDEVVISYREDATVAGYYYIIITALFGGQGSYIYPMAESPDDAFYFLGFTSAGIIKNRTEIQASPNLLTVGGSLKMLHVPSSIMSSSFNYIGAAADRLWIISSDPARSGTLSATVGETVSISVSMDGGGTLLAEAQVIGLMNQNSYGALLVQLPSSSDTLFNNNYNNLITSFNVTDSNGLTNVIALSAAEALNNKIISLLGENFKLCFDFSQSTILPYTYGSTPFFDEETCQLVWDTATKSVVKGALSFVIDSSIELTLGIRHISAGSAMEITTQLTAGSPAFTLDNAENLNDIYADLFSNSTTSVTANTSTHTSASDSGTIGVAVTVGTNSSINLLENVSVSTLSSLESVITSATTLDAINKAVCSLLNSERPSDPTFVFVPLLSNKIAVVSTTNDVVTLGVSSTRPVNYNGQSYGRSLLDYVINHSATDSIPSTLSNSYGVSNPITGFHGSTPGTSTPSNTKLVASTAPHNGTRFSLTQGGDERQLIVDIQDNEEYFYGVYPKAHANLEIDVEDMPRNPVFTANYTGADCCTMFLGGSVSAIDLGVRTGDLLYLHEQRDILDSTGLNSLPFSPKKDRVLHVVHNDARREITVLSSAGTFLNPETLNATNNQTPGSNSVKIGDIVFFESTGAYSTVTTVKDTVVTLSSSVSGITNELVLKYSNNGTLTNNTFVDTNIQFTSADVGKYLVLYGSEQENVDGSYAITSVDLSGVITIDVETELNETNLHWAVVKPGNITPGSSTINGRTETLGVTPVRIYSGTPNRLEIGRVSPDIVPGRSTIEVLYGDSLVGPKRGIKQPYKILRPTECRITASEMEEQGPESSLYYFDVPVTTLTPTYDLNIPENTQCTPVYNTYSSAGYYFTVDNTALVFSTREQTKFSVTSSILSSESNGDFSKAIQMEMATVSATYYTSSVVSQIQYLLSGDSTKSVAADPLARHFLPSYIYLSLPVLEGDTDSATEAVIQYINDLQPNEELRLSKIEKQLQFYELDSYSHPMFMYCVTTDLDRNVILTRSNDVVNDLTIKHNGTNRITNFIATDTTVNLEGE